MIKWAEFMHKVQLVLFSLLAALVAVVVTDHLSVSHLPPCDLIAEGVSVAAGGCDSTPSIQSYACKGTPPNSSAMTRCVEKHYYAYRTFPFSLKQRFGQGARTENNAAQRWNETATFATTFGLSCIVQWGLARRRRRRVFN